MPRLYIALLPVVLALTVSATGCGDQPAGYTIPPAIHKIRHVVVIMQENRSFDSYFGTFPGADGIPMKNGVPTVCIPGAAGQPCLRPYYRAANRDVGGPHTHSAAVADIAGGRMNGFVTT